MTLYLRSNILQRFEHYSSSGVTCKESNLCSILTTYYTKTKFVIHLSKSLAHIKIIFQPKNSCLEKFTLCHIAQEFVKKCKIPCYDASARPVLHFIYILIP